VGEQRHEEIVRREDADPKGRKRGLIVRIQVDYSRAGKLLRYSLSLIDLSSSLDNGRIVGYDNAHGQHHRHHFGRVDRGVWIVWSLNPMKRSKASLKRRSASILKRAPASDET
jgi:hypothetical protein